MIRHFLASILVSGCLPLSAAESNLAPEVRQIALLLREKAFTGTRATEWARSLADEVGPRPAGSDGDRAAVAWAVAKMKSIGLSNVRAERVRVAVWTRGLETGEVLTTPGSLMYS